MDSKFKGKNTWSRHPEYDNGFKAGQQSKHAEIDALQKRIDEALNVFKSDLSEIGKFDTIHKILKGELK